MTEHSKRPFHAEHAWAFDLLIARPTFARALRPSGVLILDVREWEASAARKTREPVFKKSFDTDRGKLTFTSQTELDRQNRQLILSERHTLVEDGQERSSDYRFVMRCWTRGELESGLTRNGFGHIACFGAYDPTVPVVATDRLVVSQRVTTVMTQARKSR